MTKIRYNTSEKCALYPLDYKNRDTRVFLYFFGRSLAEPTKLSKSFSQFVAASQLETMQQLATHKQQILMPSVCLSNQRKAKFKRENTFGFRCSKHYYFMLDASELTKSEIESLYKFCRALKHNRGYFAKIKKDCTDRHEIFTTWKHDFLKLGVKT